MSRSSAFNWLDEVAVMSNGCTDYVFEELVPLGLRFDYRGLSLCKQVCLQEAKLAGISCIQLDI
jgi:hypothetical protein